MCAKFRGLTRKNGVRNSRGHNFGRSIWTSLYTAVCDTGEPPKKWQNYLSRNDRKHSTQVTLRSIDKPSGTNRSASHSRFTPSVVDSCGEYLNAIYRRWHDAWGSSSSCRKTIKTSVNNGCWTVDEGRGVKRSLQEKVGYLLGQPVIRDCCADRGFSLTSDCSKIGYRYPGRI